MLFPWKYVRSSQVIPQMAALCSKQCHLELKVVTEFTVSGQHIRTRTCVTQETDKKRKEGDDGQTINKSPLNLNTNSHQKPCAITKFKVRLQIII